MHYYREALRIRDESPAQLIWPKKSDSYPNGSMSLKSLVTFAQLSGAAELAG